MPILEALGIARRESRVRFGGKNGGTYTLKAGDVAMLPAGTGRDDFGACAPAGTSDECTIVADRPRARKSIPKAPSARKDPIYGMGGPLSNLWKKAK